MIGLDEIIQNVLKEAVKELDKIQQSKKGTRKRRDKINILEGQQEKQGEDKYNLEQDDLQYTETRNYNWFINFINRRENKNLMPSKQGSLYKVFNKQDSKLVLTFNMDTFEVKSSFNLSTILGLQKPKA